MQINMKFFTFVCIFVKDYCLMLLENETILYLYLELFLVKSLSSEGFSSDTKLRHGTELYCWFINHIVMNVVDAYSALRAFHHV